MSFNNYLLNLANISNEIGYSLTYGYGDIAVTEINSLKALIAKSEEMIPILEAEACIAEAEELDREERSFNNWMTMLYGNDSVSPIDTHNINKTNRLKRRKQNKKHHKADRYHGKCFEGRNEEGKRIYKDRYCRNPVSDRVKYSDNAIKAREQEYYSSYPVEKEAKEVEVAETTEEAGTFDNFLWRLVDELPEQKYIVLFSFDNGQSYEDRDGCTNEFRGVMTKDEVIAELTKIFLWNDCKVEIGETEVKGLKGAKFNWDFGCDKWGWNGYESFTIIPVSRLN